MLKAIIPPSTANLMAPATVQAALGLPDSELPNLARQVKAVSGIVAGYLRFPVGYGAWEETVTSAAGPVLDLSARPAWTVSEVLDWQGTDFATTAYRLERGPFGESSLVRVGSWGLYDGADPYRYQNLAGGAVSFPLVVGGAGVDSVPDWTIRYTAGWWLEEMTGSKPAEVDPLPAEIKDDFLSLLLWKRALEGVPPNIYRMANEGMSVDFLRHRDQDLDALSGLPTQLTLSLSLYRRVT
jgi:hypothetical protein